MADSENPRADAPGDDGSPPRPPTPPNLENMRAAYETFTTELGRVVNIQNQLVTQDKLTSAMQSILDRLDGKFADLNQKLDDHKRDLNQKLDDHKRDLNQKLDDRDANIAVAVAASVSNSQVKGLNAAIRARNRRLMPIYSVRTGDRVDGTAITINTLRSLDADRAGALLRAAGLPDTGTAAERRSRLAAAMGVAEANLE